MYHIFFVQFGFLIGFHGITGPKYYISLIDLILDIVILVLFQSISLFIMLSQTHNNYTFYKYALFFSVVSNLAILFSIAIYILCLIFGNKYHIIPNCKCEEKKKLGYCLIVLKVVELVPSISIFIIKNKIKKSPGTIDMNFSDLDIIKRNNNDNS